MNYKKNRILISVKCDNCNNTFEKPKSEFERNNKLGRRNFCSRSCLGRSNYKNFGEKISTYDISAHSSNRRDELTPFRYIYSSCKRRFKDFNITLEDLKDQWNLQKGICPYTLISLKIPSWSKVFIEYSEQASIDRIDSSLGYVKRNIEFVSLPINYMKSNKMSKEEVFIFID